MRPPLSNVSLLYHVKNRFKTWCLRSTLSIPTSGGMSEALSGMLGAIMSLGDDDDDGESAASATVTNGSSSGGGDSGRSSGDSTGMERAQRAVAALMVREKAGGQVDPLRLSLSLGLGLSRDVDVAPS